MIFGSQGHSRSSTISSLDRATSFHRHYESVLYRFRDKASYSLKVANISSPRVLGAHTGRTPVEFDQDLRRPKSRVPEPLRGVVSHDPGFIVLTELGLVTDILTDRQTVQGRSI